MLRLHALRRDALSCFRDRFIFFGSDLSGLVLTINNLAELAPRLFFHLTFTMLDICIAKRLVRINGCLLERLVITDLERGFV